MRAESVKKMSGLDMGKNALGLGINSIKKKITTKGDKMYDKYEEMKDKKERRKRGEHDKILVIMCPQVGQMKNGAENKMLQIDAFVEKNRAYFDSVVVIRYIGAKDREEKENAKQDILIHKGLNNLIDRIIDVNTVNAWHKIERKFKCKDNDFVFCGFNTCSNVLATVVGCLDAGGSYWVISDLCASSFGYDSHRAAIRVLYDVLDASRIVKSTNVLGRIYNGNSGDTTSDTGLQKQ